MCLCAGVTVWFDAGALCVVVCEMLYGVCIVAFVCDCVCLLDACLCVRLIVQCHMVC